MMIDYIINIVAYKFKSLYGVNVDIYDRYYIVVESIGVYGLVCRMHFDVDGVDVYIDSNKYHRVDYGNLIDIDEFIGTILFMRFYG